MMSGVETLTAESLVVTDRRALYVHPQTGAETQVFTIRRRERNRPFSARRGAWTARTNPARRAAGQRAVRPRRRAGPGAEPHARRWRGRTPRPPAAADGAHRDAARRRWRRRIGRRPTGPPSPSAWEAEIAEVPAFTDSDLHIVTGLLLPIWKRLPDESMRVYRLQTDAGERIIGRLVSPAWVAQAVERRGANASRPADAWSRRARRSHHPRTAGRAQLRRAKVMGDVPGRALRLHRRHGRSPEGDGPHLRDHLLEAAPVRADRRDRSGDPRLKLMERYPLVRIADRAAA